MPLKAREVGAQKRNLGCSVPPCAVEATSAATPFAVQASELGFCRQPSQSVSELILVFGDGTPWLGSLSQVPTVVSGESVRLLGLAGQAVD